MLDCGIVLILTPVPQQSIVDIYLSIDDREPHTTRGAKVRKSKQFKCSIYHVRV